MHKIIFTLSIIIVISTHLFAFNYLFQKEEIKISKPKYQKISMQLAQIKKSKPVKKEKKIEKPIEKETFVKKIKKDAKRKLVKKKKKIIKKKVVKKKIVKKEPSKKIVKKEILKAPIKKVKTPSLKERTKSLSLYKKSKETYMTKLRTSIDKNKKYPRASKRFKEQGKVVVSFRVYKDGRFENMRIIEKSSKKRLNKAALNALLLTKQFDVFPKELQHKDFIDCTLAMQFRLR